MERITLDFETYYDKDYSLRKMTPVEYVLDPRFETIMLSVKRPGKEPLCVWGDNIRIFFSLLDPKNTVIINHNSLFDMCIAAWHYGFVPAMMVDTMAMARAWLGAEVRSVSLDFLSLYLKLGVKGKEVAKMAGLHEADIRAMGLWDDYVVYCKGDSLLTEKLFEWLIAQGFPLAELEIIDMVLRTTIIPQFQINEAELAQHHQDIITEKNNLLTSAMLVGANDKKQLMSNPQFADLLRSLGVEPPTKISPTTGREAYAFSKSDQAFTDLENHPDLAVQAVVAARLGHKSTIEETRTERLLNIARLFWPKKYLTSRGIIGGALMPMPLRYSGAHTHRLSGDWKLNVQNFPSRGKVNHLKCALIARAGHQVLNIDSSQIEARIVAWLAFEQDLLLQFEQGLDPYKIFAAKVFGVEVSAVTKEQRFLGKTSILGLGFGLGWTKFKAQVRVKSLEAVKLTGQGQELILDDAQALMIVNTYRNTFPGVPRLWRALNNAISVLAGNGGSFNIGPCVFEKGRILLPSGLYLNYPNLRQEQDGWVYDNAGKPRRLYGGALLENIVQALARCIVMDAAIRIKHRIAAAGITLALQVHDALAYVVPDHLVFVVGKIMMEEMNRRPAWAQDLPLAAELGVGPSYGECKEVKWA